METGKQKARETVEDEGRYQDLGPSFAFLFLSDQPFPTQNKQTYDGPDDMHREKRVVASVLLSFPSPRQLPLWSFVLATLY